MELLPILLGLLCCSGAFGATFYRCYWINSQTVDCTAFAPNETCGSDLVTYKNKCEFSRAHCLNDTLNLKHYGACTTGDGFTPAPVNVNGHDVVFDFMCTNLSHMKCPVDGERVCASDGRSYDNYCEYEKAKCTHRKLMAVNCIV